MSHPLRVRGLKLEWLWGEIKKQFSRTLYGCVDWNSFSLLSSICLFTSHPLRVRGLKFRTYLYVDGIIWSHPLRVRGLKSRRRPDHLGGVPVAPFTGAWIEMGCIVQRWIWKLRRTLYGCVDWNAVDSIRLNYLLRSHPLRVRGLKFPLVHHQKLAGSVAPLRVRGLKYLLSMN